jgi:hypothetical protein
MDIADIRTQLNRSKVQWGIDYCRLTRGQKLQRLRVGIRKIQEGAELGDKLGMLTIRKKTNVVRLDYGFRTSTK